MNPLFVGIDVSSRSNVAYLMKPDGSKYSSFSVQNNLGGAKLLSEKIVSALRSMQLERVVIGLQIYRGTVPCCSCRNFKSARTLQKFESGVCGSSGLKSSILKTLQRGAEIVMEDRQIVIGGFYRHFKDKLYQVRCIAYHSETKEKMVVYQALYGDYAVYVRPYEMFMSEVDHEKYPEVTQKYRFEQVNPVEEPAQREVAKALEKAQEVQPQTAGAEKLPDTQENSELEPVESIELEELPQEGGVNPYLLLFLDAESYTEKLNVLSLCKDKLDDSVINAMAASMEIEVPDGPIEKRYASLRDCIRTHVRYEGTRLR